MIVLPLLFGLFFMLASYILISLAGTALMSYCFNNVVETVYLFFSIPARLRKQFQNYWKKRARLKKTYYKKTKLIWKKTISRQLALHNRNTKNQIQFLAKSTKKQLHLYRKNLSPEERREIQQSIKQCVAQLDMNGLLKINFSLLDFSQHPELLLADSKN